jgi:hypothetical protein
VLLVNRDLKETARQVAGYAVIYGGDDRWIGNVFLSGDIETAYAYDTTKGPHCRRRL